VAAAESAGPPPQRRPLRLTVEDSASTLVLRMAGDLDLAGIGQVMAALDRLDVAHTTELVFDLRELAFLDLAGLKTILRANDFCKNHHIPVTVIKPRGLAHRVFILTRVHLELDLVESLATDHTTRRVGTANRRKVVGRNPVNRLPDPA
jgi:anti-anti-sigma factor